jgi:hypothetical protein
MIQITPQMRILLAVEPVDFRRGIDGLAALCRQALGSDPQTGALFVFRSRRGHAIKCLTYDGQGYGCCQKRLSGADSRLAWARRQRCPHRAPSTAPAALEWRPLPCGGGAAVASGADGGVKVTVSARLLPLPGMSLVLLALSRREIRRQTPRSSSV